MPDRGRSRGAVSARAVICDFGGVLTTSPWAAFSAWREESGLTAEELRRATERATEAAGGRHPLLELELGHITEAELRRRIEEFLGEDVRLPRVTETYFAHLHPNPAMIDYMRSLRERGLRLALLTNNVREWEALWRAKLPEVDRIFEVVVNSALVGMRKPDPRVYRLALARLGGGLRPQDCVFVDDLEANCRTARELGMRAIRFGDTEQAIAAIEAAVT